MFVRYGISFSAYCHLLLFTRIYVVYILELFSYIFMRWHITQSLLYELWERIANTAFLIAILNLSQLEMNLNIFVILLILLFWIAELRDIAAQITKKNDLEGKWKWNDVEFSCVIIIPWCGIGMKPKDATHAKRNQRGENVEKCRNSYDRMWQNRIEPLLLY